DRQGVLWVGTVGGLARMEGQRFTSWTTRNGLPHNYVRAIYEDTDNVHWIGTYGGGLARFDGHRFVVYNRKNGLYDNIVSSILEDAHGNLWMSGNRGVFRASRRMLDAYAAGTIPQILSIGYGPSDGLLTAETNGGFEPAAWQDADGRLWYPTVRGLATVNPNDAVPNTHPPSVMVEALRADGRAYAVVGNVRVPVGTRSLEVDYTGLTSVAPEQLVFRYRLSGLNEDWQYVNDRRTAYYSGLRPGTYVFEVAAANRDGLWSADSEPLTLIVPPDWYQTLWFRVLAILVVVGTAVVLVRRRIAHLHAQQRVQREFSRQLIAAQEQERGRLAGELHDSLGQDLLVMKNRAAIALRAVGLDPALRAHLDEISEVASSAVQNAREISHALRPYQLDRLGLAAAIRDLGQRVAASGGPSVDVDAAESDASAPSAQAIHLFRIVQEALNNILKHADAMHVTIRLHPDDTGLRLVISDDGRGMDMSTARGFGLTGIAQRVHLLGATLDVQSAPGRGTTLDIRVPTGVA
ncbi:MAG TPA: ATP-binding protein, partial [Gemmatimonadaceae bacterium]